jgi:ribose transport system permease protein
MLADIAKDAATSAAPVQPARRKGSESTLRDVLGLAAVYAVIFVTLALLSPFFLSAQNMVNLLMATAILAIVAVFTTMLMISGGLDLSVGSVVALTGVVIAVLQPVVGIWPAALAGLLAGVLFGALNGLLVTRVGINAVITTLGTLYVARGAALVLSNGLTKPVFDEGFAVLGAGLVFGVPIPVLIALILFLIGIIVLNYTTYGRALYAVGGNAEASRLAALPVKRYQFLAYLFSGFSAGLAGVVLTSRLYAAAPQAATGLEFSVIAAVVLGGTSLAGGKGTLLGTFLGVLILGTLNNGMTLLSLSSDYQQIVQGTVLLLAVAIDQVRLGAVDIAVLRRKSSF